MATKTPTGLAAIPDRVNTAVRDTPPGALRRVADLIREANSQSITSQQYTRI